MADGEFQRASHEHINAFAVDGYYLFAHYFDGDEVFERLSRYYNNQQYRFEVPTGDFESIRLFVAKHDYALVAVDEGSISAFVVAVRKYTAHPDNIFKASERSSLFEGCRSLLGAFESVLSEQRSRDESGCRNSIVR